MKVVRTVAALSAAIAERRAQGQTIGFAPTMGFLHEGHLSLFDRARAECDVAVTSIFVNPLQFGAGEDLESYPRDLERDLAQAEGRGVDVAFTPSVAEMYPAGSSPVTVSPGPMADGLCGRYRPGHFAGVLTVVARLFHLVAPDVAVFGRKDFQQGVLIQRMTEDLNLSVRIVLAPIVREPDGLALSSRNAKLTAPERAQATGLSATLQDVAEAFAGGVTEVASLQTRVREQMDGYPDLQVQYADFVSPDTLEKVSVASADTVLAIAAFSGETRLIDNRRLGDACG